MSAQWKSRNRELLRCWREFSKTVRIFAEKRSERNEIRQEDYESVHADLLKSLGESIASNPEQSQTHVAMKDLAEPWVSIAALKQADAAVLKDLADRCDGLNRELKVGTTAQKPQSSSLLILIVIFLAAFAVVLGMDVWSGVYDKFFDGSGGALGEFVQAIERNRNNLRTVLISLIVAAATAIVAWLVFRAPKNY